MWLCGVSIGLLILVASCLLYCVVFMQVSEEQGELMCALSLKVAP